MRRRTTRGRACQLSRVGLTTLTLNCITGLVLQREREKGRECLDTIDINMCNALKWARSTDTHHVRDSHTHTYMHAHMETPNLRTHTQAFLVRCECVCVPDKATCNWMASCCSKQLAVDPAGQLSAGSLGLTLCMQVLYVYCESGIRQAQCTRTGIFEINWLNL